MPTTSVVQILTASIAPVIVISGVGLLLLSISNRYGRAIDRARLIMREPVSPRRSGLRPFAPCREGTGGAQKFSRSAALA